VNVVRKSWLVEESKVNGCVILAFNVHRDGTIDEIVIRHPSSTSAYNENARQALVRAGRVEPLPADYDREFAAITVTFFYRMGATPAVAPLKP